MKIWDKLGIFCHCLYAIIFILLYPPLERGDGMFSNIIAAIIGGIILYFICKWLDCHFK